MSTHFSKCDKLLTMDQLRELVPFSKVHVYRLIQLGEFPRQVHLTERRVAWIESEVRTWIAERVEARQ